MASSALRARLPLLPGRSLLGLTAGMPLLLASKIGLLLRISHLRLIVTVIVLLWRLESFPLWLVVTMRMPFLVFVSLLKLFDLLRRHLTADLLLWDHRATALIGGRLRLYFDVTGLVFLLEVGGEGVVAALRLGERVLLLRGVLLALGKVGAGLARELTVGRAMAQRSGGLLVLVSRRPLLCIRLRLALGLLVVCFTISLDVLLLLVFSRLHASRLVPSLG